MSSNQKRHFPYGGDVDGFQVKRPSVIPAGSNPGRAYVEPKVYQEPNYHAGPLNVTSTDFGQWSNEELKAFLEQRGGDYQESGSRQELVALAHETEVNTGPAGDRRVYAGNITGAAGGAPTEDEVDPLEAFMAEINQEVSANKPTGRVQPDAALACDEEADPAAEYMAARKAAGLTASMVASAVAAEGLDSDEEVYETAKALERNQGLEYDKDDNVVGLEGRKVIEPLTALDHGSIDYEDFAKDFYEEAPDVAAMTDAEVNTLRRQLEIRVAGFGAPKPIQRFDQCGFDASLLATIKKAGYDKPTAIQAQALPAALSGRDVLGIAKTGSGKTAAFVLPLMVHIMDQPELDKGSGPIGVIVAPTRELAEQIHKETRKFSKPYGLRVCAGFGGLSKYEQFKDLKAGSEVVVATPGRMIDLIKMKACTMLRATYLVLDEADRMFDMGFEPQVRSILGQIRPDRQTLLFSATMPKKIERLVGEALTDPVRITVGGVGVANEDVKQIVEVVDGEGAKVVWLAGQLGQYIDEGEVLVFANQKAKVESLVEQFISLGIKAVAIHGDMDQYTRMKVLDGFRSGDHHVLVATDVAARGLDIKTLKTVINYDMPKDFDTFIHRVGRTGRAGDKEGVAVSLLTQKDARLAGHLVQSLTLAGQEVTKALYDLALKDSRFKKGSSRNKGKGGGRRRPQVGGAGLGFQSGGPSSNPYSGPKPTLPGFARSSSDTGVAAQVGGPSNTFVQLPGFAPSSQRYECEGPGPGPAPGLAPAASQSQVPPPASASSSGWQGANNMVKSFYSDRFRSSFVSSGTTGGDISEAPTIVAPRSAPSKPVPPPPIPVTVIPPFASQSLGQRSSFHLPAAAILPPAQAAADTAAAQAAIAAAQAIAARLSRSAPSGGPPETSATSSLPTIPAAGTDDRGSQPHSGSSAGRTERRRWDRQ